VDYLISSHAHEDHMIFNHLFPDSKFCIHYFDAPCLADIDSLIDSYGNMADEEKGRWREFLQNDCHYQPRIADVLLKDAMILNLGEVEIEVIHTAV